MIINGYFSTYAKKKSIMCGDGCFCMRMKWKPRTEQQWILERFQQKLRQILKQKN